MNAGERRRTYSSWYAMQCRCTDPRNPSWLNYGGRGITVCDRWQDFDTFIADMGVRPADRSIDRIDVNGNYEPSNCRWATVAEQSTNKRRHGRLPRAGRVSSVRIAIRVTDAERALWQTAADESGQSLSEWLRVVLNAET